MTKKYIILISIIASLTFLSVGCNLLGKRYEKTETITYRLNPAGKTKLTVLNLSGEIDAVKNNSDSLIISECEKIDKVKKKDLSKPLDNIKIKLDSSGQQISIETLNTFTGISFNINNEGNKVNYRVSLPEKLMVSLIQKNGKMIIENITNDIEGTVMNGTLQFTNLTGKTFLDVNNGKIIGNIDSLKDTKVSVSNGKIEINLNKTFTGRVKAEVNQGKLDYNNLVFSNFVSDKKSLQGYIGSGNNMLDITVNNGKIILTGK